MKGGNLLGFWDFLGYFASGKRDGERGILGQERCEGGNCWLGEWKYCDAVRQPWLVYTDE